MKFKKINIKIKKRLKSLIFCQMIVFYYLKCCLCVHITLFFGNLLGWIYQLSKRYSPKGAMQWTVLFVNVTLACVCRLCWEKASAPILAHKWQNKSLRNSFIIIAESLGLLPSFVETINFTSSCLIIKGSQGPQVFSIALWLCDVHCTYSPSF